MKIVISPYDQLWPYQFEFYKGIILKAADDCIKSISHIGSTAVPGLAAKPVIDILVGAKDEHALEMLIPSMIRRGFTYMKKFEHLMPERRYFVKYERPDGKTPPEILSDYSIDMVALGFLNVAHIHCWVDGSVHCIRHLAFRDYLRAHEDVRNQYQQLKEKLAEKDWPSALEYSEAKDDFIKATEWKAIEWYQANKSE